MIKLLILIISYKTAKNLVETIYGIPENIFLKYDTEILIIDDASKDDTFESIDKLLRNWNKCKITFLENPEFLGYGGNLKLGYEYSIINDYFIVLHFWGSGKYYIENIDKLIEPIIEENYDVVLGSRFISNLIHSFEGIPILKYIGIKILNNIENLILKKKLTDYHSGLRAFQTKTLKLIHYKYNSNDLIFDTEILFQLFQINANIKEIKIKSDYSKDLMYNRGLKYFFNVIGEVITYLIHNINLNYKRKYDPKNTNSYYDIKLNYKSSHSVTIDLIPDNSTVIDIGCGEGYVAKELKNKNCYVVGLDKGNYDNNNFSKFISWDLDLTSLPQDLKTFDYILLLDIIEHLKSPEYFIDMLRDLVNINKPQVIISVPNIGFFITRLALFFGQFNYGKVGILDRTHTRLFTFRSLKELLNQSGYKNIKTIGIPAPYPKAIGLNKISRFLLWINSILIKLNKNIFSYQILVMAQPNPTVENLLKYTINYSKTKKEQYNSINIINENIFNNEGQYENSEFINRK
jgi:2-polyprenyl-3-methyl-5-hydroxy-6-metoxy-1,4-benzoquinol methylase